MRCLNGIKAIILVVAFVLSTFAFAAAPASGITYTGRILDPNDQALTSGNVTFNVWVQTPNNCTLYSEQHVVNMTGSFGTYSLEIGKGATPAFPHSAFGIKNLFDVFDNSKKPADFNPALEPPCAAVSLAEDDARILRVEFIPPGQTAAQALPPLMITAVPLAMQANRIGGYGSGELLKVAPTVNQTQGNLTQANYDEFIKLILGTSTTYLKTLPALGGDVSGTLPAMTVNGIRGFTVPLPSAPADNNKGYSDFLVGSSA